MHRGCDPARSGRLERCRLFGSGRALDLGHEERGSFGDLREIVEPGIVLEQRLLRACEVRAAPFVQPARERGDALLAVVDRDMH